MSDFLGYLHRISKGARRAEYARIAGVSPSTVTRWDDTRPDHIQPKADVVITLAHHYGRPALEALAAAGIVSAQDLHLPTVEKPLSEYPHRALLRELERRLDSRMSEAHGTITSPAQYGEEPTPDEYDLAAGDVARDPAAD